LRFWGWVFTTPYTLPPTPYNVQDLKKKGGRQRVSRYLFAATEYARVQGVYHGRRRAL